MRRIAAVVGLVVLLVTAQQIGRGGIIRLDNSPGGLGEKLDGISGVDLGTPSAGPFSVPGLEPLSVSITDLDGFGPLPTLNSTAIGLGINSAGLDASGRFDADFGERLTLWFSEAVQIQQLDFRHFGAGEAFDFAGVTITNDALSNRTTDLFDFATPLTIAAATPFTIRSTIGSIGIEAISLDLAGPTSAEPNLAVPEPSTMVTMATMAISCLSIRRRAKQRPSVNRQ